MSETRHHSIPMSDELAGTLQRLEAGGADAAAGPLLYALGRALGPQRSLVLADAPLYETLWLALGTQRRGSELVVVSESGVEALRATLHEVQPREALHLLQHELAAGLPALDGLFDLVLLDLNASYYAPLWQALQPHLSPHALVLAAGARQQAERLDALLRELEQAREWQQVIVDKGQGWLLAARGERVPAYEQSARERFIALFLQVAQPANLLLGQNIVFDGALKPRGSRINFSGTGGQVGAGDVLLSYPEELQRYTPQPGATALVLGALSEPITTPTVVLPLGGEVLTLVVA